MRQSALRHGREALARHQHKRLDKLRTELDRLDRDLTRLAELAADIQRG